MDISAYAKMQEKRETAKVKDFAENLAAGGADTLRALRWGDSFFLSAALANEWRKVGAYLKVKAADEVVEDLKRDIWNAALYPPQSSSATHNLCQLAETQAKATVLRFLEEKNG